MKPVVREGTFAGGLPYLSVGSGQPLVYLCGSTPNHRNAKPGLERTATLGAVQPLARHGFQVFFTNRWPNMPDGITFAEVADRHAEALTDHFGEPVDVLGHSTGGSLTLQLIVDRPEVVRRAVVASAAYALGPVAKQAQLEMMHALEATGRFSTDAIIDGLRGVVRADWLRRLATPLAALAAQRITVENPTDAIAMLRAEDAFDVGDRLAAIPTETLVVYGGKDRFWTQEMFAETAERIPRATGIRYPDRGHALTTATEFVRDVTAFLQL